MTQAFNTSHLKESNFSQSPVGFVECTPKKTNGENEKYKKEDKKQRDRKKKWGRMRGREEELMRKRTVC